MLLNNFEFSRSMRKSSVLDYHNLFILIQNNTLFISIFCSSVCWCHVNIGLPHLVYMLGVDSLHRRTHKIFTLKHTLLHLYFLLSPFIVGEHAFLENFRHFSWRKNRISTWNFKFWSDKMPFQPLMCYNSFQNERCSHILEEYAKQRWLLQGEI